MSVALVTARASGLTTECVSVSVSFNLSLSCYELMVNGEWGDPDGCIDN